MALWILKSIGIKLIDIDIYGHPQQGYWVLLELRWKAVSLYMQDSQQEKDILANNYCMDCGFLLASTENNTIAIW